MPIHTMMVNSASTSSSRYGLRRLAALVFLSSLVFAQSGAQASILNEVGLGLGAAGFDIRGNNNPLSGGARVLVTNTFQGEEFDFGTWQLAFDGPISLDVSTGGRYLSNLDIGLNTAANGDAASAPLDYRLTFDSGNQQTTVNGSVFIDGDFSMNGFGFYDLGLQYSSRQTVVNEGEVDDSEQEFDADFGPINVEGNIFVDAIAVVTAPIFEAAGVDNPFEPMSGTAQLKRLVEAQVNTALAELAASRQPSTDTYGVFAQTRGLGILSGADDFTASPVVAPEPTVLLLMLLGIPAVLLRPRRRKAA